MQLAAKNGNAHIIGILLKHAGDKEEKEKAACRVLMTVLMELQSVRTQLKTNPQMAALLAKEQAYKDCIQTILAHDPLASARKYFSFEKWPHSPAGHSYVQINAIIYALTREGLEDMAEKLINRLPEGQGTLLDESLYRLQCNFTTYGESRNEWPSFTSSAKHTEPMTALEAALMTPRDEAKKVALVLTLLQKGARECRLFGGMPKVIDWLTKLQDPHPTIQPVLITLNAEWEQERGQGLLKSAAAFFKGTQKFTVYAQEQYTSIGNKQIKRNDGGTLTLNVSVMKYRLPVGNEETCVVEKLREQRHSASDPSFYDGFKFDTPKQQSAHSTRRW